jgi:predicted transcriptional regulator
MGATMRNTKAQTPIMNLLKETPNLNFIQIAERTNIKRESVKAILCRLTKNGVIDRERQAPAEKPKNGPQSLYVYRVKEGL